MPDLWLPEAIKVPGNNGLRQGAGGGRGKRIHTHHSFEAPYTLGTVVACRYLNSKGSTSHFTFNPVTGEIGQMLPMDQAARTLRVTDPRTGEFADVNRYGDVHAQTEVIAYAARPWTLDLTAAGMRGLILWMNFLRSWGIPDQWAWKGQAPPAYPGPGVRRRLPDRSGHAYHSGWPVNDHGDPGAIAAPWTIVGTTRPSPAPPPRAPEWPEGWIAHAQELLNALGYTDADGRELAVDDSLGPATEHATRSYQADAGLDVDGRPGADTTASLEETMSKIDDVLTRLDSLPTDVWRVTIGAEGAQARSWLRGGNLKAGRASDAAQESVAKIGALEAAVSALATGKGADPEAIREAARQGAADALAGITVTVGVEG